MIYRTTFTQLFKSNSKQTKHKLLIHWAQIFNWLCYAMLFIIIFSCRFRHCEYLFKKHSLKNVKKHLPFAAFMIKEILQFPLHPYSFKPPQLSTLSSLVVSVTDWRNRLDDEKGQRVRFSSGSTGLGINSEKLGSRVGDRLDFVFRNIFIQ